MNEPVSNADKLRQEIDQLRAENADLKERIDKAYEDVALDQRTNATLRADLAIAKTDLLLTQARSERLRAEVAALKAQRDPLAEMWRELEAYQPMADRYGHGESWRTMCRERSPFAAYSAAARSAAGVSDAAARVGWAVERAASSIRAASDAIAAIRRAKEARP